MNLARPALVALLLALGACGKKEPAPTPAPDATAAPAPAPTPDGAAPAPTPAPDDATPTPAPPEAKGWVAWHEGPDGELTTALFEDRGGALTQVATRKGDAVVAVDGVVWKLGRARSTYPLKPCDEAAEAELVDLALTGVEPTRPQRALTLGDTKLRPARDANHVHIEALHLRAQVGPLVLVEHEMNSDICPVPGTGATYTVLRVLDLRQAEADTPIPLSDPRAAFTPAELEAATQHALAEGRKRITADHPEVPAADLDRSLKLFDVSFAWSDEGTVTATLGVVAKSAALSEMEGEEGTAYEPVPAPAVPAALTSAPVPPAVLAFWKDGKEGRGLSPVSGQAFETLRLWLAAP